MTERMKPKGILTLPLTSRYYFGRWFEEGWNQIRKLRRVNIVAVTCGLSAVGLLRRKMDGALKLRIVRGRQRRKKYSGSAK